MRHRPRRSGYTLLEIILASSMLTVMATATAVILRGGQLTWLAHEEDLSKIASAQAVLRHITRQVRQAEAVTAISPESSTSGNLSVLMPDGSTYAWAHQSARDLVNFGLGKPDQLLADQIAELAFIGYERDAVTKTTVVDDIYLIEARAAVARATGTQVFSCKAWLRAW